MTNHRFVRGLNGDIKKYGEIRCHIFDEKGIYKGKIIVADAKYYKDALTKNQFGSRTIRSAHLYQLSTYLEHYKRKQPGAELKGMGADVRYSYLS